MNITRQHVVQLNVDVIPAFHAGKRQRISAGVAQEGALFGKQYWEGFGGGKAALMQCCPTLAAPGSAAVW